MPTFPDPWLKRASDRYLHLYHRLPATIEELQPLHPFAEGFDPNWRFLEAVRSDGYRAYLAERPIPGPDAKPDFHREPWLRTLWPMLRGYKPAVEQRDGVERYAMLYNNPPGYPWTVVLEVLPSHTEGIPRVVRGESPGGWPDRVPAKDSPKADALGFIAVSLEDYFRYNHSSGAYPPAVSSLEELADLHGGFNPLFWVNPYTGEPIRKVPLDRPTPGDYSEGGTGIYFHYLDARGGISRVTVGHLVPKRPTE
ncbi:MAG TPA: hypothetical protein VEI97_17100 [bacterium]|nr:hypothetical protein [bacterium]